MIVLAASLAVVAGWELVARDRLAVLGWAVVASAPFDAGLLLAANWREHASRSFGGVLVTTTLFLLSGIVVSLVALVADARTRLGRRGFRAVCACIALLDVLALVVTWSGSLPGEALRALIALVFLTLVLALVTPLAQRLS
jgi:CDP-diglyceride synthetase